MPFSSQATSDLKTAFEDACKDGEKGLPGVVGVVIGKDGTELFAQASAGLGYTFFHEGLRDHSKPIGFDEFSGHLSDMIQPLVHQPGKGWQYGVALAPIKRLHRKPLTRDVAWHRLGWILRRAHDQTVVERLLSAAHILTSRLKNISMFPTASMKANLAYMNGRGPDGVLFPRDHLLHRPLVVSDQADMDRCCNSGGAGCFAKPQEYCQILAMLLNDGTSPTNGAKILKKETVDTMFENQISQFPDFSKQGIPASKADLTNAIPDLYPGQHQGWGLTFMLSDGPTGRSPTTGHWAGLPNLYWWCDRAQGVAGIICCQLLPFADPQALNLWVALESAAYKALA
ncbi:hypothetical protein LTS16_010915 [Friedmanniomyces endolithicus]|nr:hypothetical protein LTR57_019358 [Friedmanniomyces endolithicus]KAK0976369.1 hypothetical protein LTS01_013513 [Friedmanniomyces endolithicus]KAK1039799.1 hypothetical protein LTS16_010915 [Friedmanniomyces endolithicus]